MINFASDNYSSVHPRVMSWLGQVNTGPAPSYGRDEITAQANEQFKKHFGPKAESFIVWNGTAANVLGLSSGLKSYQSVLCSELAHIAGDECGAPEKHLGSKLVMIPATDGKVTVDSLETYLQRVGDVHSTQPKMLSLTQATEYGTVYSVNELRALVSFAHSKNLLVHVDGARLANAAVSLNVTFKQMTTDVGVDIVSFGGTKNGLMGAEAVVFPEGKLASEFPYIRKQGLHLASKMRFLSAQFLAYFENDLWKQNATHANQMATLLGERLSKLGDKAKVNNVVQANGVFASLPVELIPEMQKQFHFYVWKKLWNKGRSEVRLICSFDTTEVEVNRFADTLQKL